MRQKFTIGVFGIIKDNKNRVLLCLRSDYDIWNLPGGSLEDGETPWEGVIREVKEETGLRVRVIKLTGIYSKPHKNEIIFCFECKIINGKLTLNDEARDIKYFSFDKIPKNTIKKHIERIEDFFKKDKNIILKIQTGTSSLKNAKKLQ
jgi:ADP-ribose pyrophosphatase YjhB (NUDIX family)